MTPRNDVRLVVRTVDRQGDGVGEATDDDVAAGAPLEVHVPGVLPGEEISARIEDVSTHRRVAWATLRKIHQPSPQRVPTSCEAYGQCGGCVLQHWDVGAQLAWKESWLRGQVAAADPILRGTPVLPLVPSPLALGYRNNAKLVAARDRSGGVVLGAYARRTHDVVDLAGCRVTEPPLEAVATTLREVLRASGVTAYDELRFTGVLRYAVMRANVSGQVLVTLVTATDSFPAGTVVASALRARHPNIVGVVQNVNPTRGNTIYGTRQLTLTGSAVIEDQIGGICLRISSGAFFQANRHVAAAAYQAIKRAAALTGTERVVDAYAGVGGIALTLAPSAGTVVGIEENAAAIDDAQASAASNKIMNTTFIVGDVAERLQALTKTDVVILNPPRKGCLSQVLRQSANLRPRLIAYLSCAPETLLRDLTTLATLGYRTERIIPFDMLPHTPHVEALAVLTPGGG